MSSKKIVGIGIDIALDDIHFEAFESKISLLDWDIILFKPDVKQYLYSSETYQGKLCLGDTASFLLKERCEHWRRELKQAFDLGKTVFVFLSQMQEIYVDSGERSYSGTGRNRSTTRHVELFNTYRSIPLGLMPVATSGKQMKLSSKGAEILSPYWNEFEKDSTYEVILENPQIKAAITTRTGEKTVGAMVRSKQSNGTILFLPDIDFYRNGFLKEIDEEQSWTPAAIEFAHRFTASILSLDKALRASTDITPEPSWASGEQYILDIEHTLRQKLLESEQKVEDAQREKEKVAEQLSAAGQFRTLLYEKGKPLENSIIEALRIMGFEANAFQESESEFDVVFECPEGRLIGEAEGKDTKAINIDKLRQLSMNIHEDLQRDDINAPAKPVLFGNGYRLQPLSERADPFTDKCKSAAATSMTALVFTPDLFIPVKYLLQTQDAVFAQMCRAAILETTGRVAFPPLPEGNVTQDYPAAR